MNETVIDIENAVVSYREDIALRGVSLKIRTGEFVGIIGPNGAGKTTLLTIVNGLGKLLSGRVWVLGQYLTQGNGHSLRKKVGYVAQVQNIDPRMPMSVREVAMIGRYGLLGLLRRPGKHDWKVVDEMLELVGMSHLARRPIGHLSGGEQQRVAIARCLAQEPELFLLDEPTASLDCLPVACDRVVLMKEGLISGEGSPSKLLTDDNLSWLYDMSISEVKKRRGESVLV